MGQAKLRKLAGTYPVQGNANQRAANANLVTRRLAFEAAQKGDLGTLKMLVRTREAANWKHPDRGLVLLDHAAFRNDVDMLRFLLEQGANPNALIASDQLVAWPAEVGDGVYFSPLATAIANGQGEILVALLAAGADLNLPKWIDDASGERVTCCDALNESPELLALIESLGLEKATGEALSQSRTRRI